MKTKYTPQECMRNRLKMQMDQESSIMRENLKKIKMSVANMEECMERNNWSSDNGLHKNLHEFNQAEDKWCGLMKAVSDLEDLFPELKKNSWLFPELKKKTSRSKK